MKINTTVNKIAINYTNNGSDFADTRLTIKNNVMAKYSEKASEKVEETMHEMKKGKLKTGTGKKVTSKKQAVAIGLSEARKEGAKVPKKKD